VTIGDIDDDGLSLSLAGLPAGYVLTMSDKGHVDFGSDPVRRYFFELSEQSVVAAGDGTTAKFRVFPSVPAGVTEGSSVVLSKPAAKMFVQAGSWNPGTASGLWTTGMSFTATQRVR
jgi:hypothetical protein